MADELVDILDENGNKTGVSKTKTEAHAKGLWHQVSHVWIYNSEEEILIQKRSMQKESWPGLWDISAAGHLAAGETPIDGALREMLEEIGIKAIPEEIKQIMMRKYSGHPTPNYYSNEFCYIYIYKTDKMPTKLQKEEVEAVKFIPIAEFEEELKDPMTMNNFVPHDYVFELIEIIKNSLQDE
ncbi:MAG: NUDIX domain-containing protein [Candidatus Micrarchaeales archaeon]